VNSEELLSADAKQLLNSQAWKVVWERVTTHYHDLLIKTDSSNTADCADIVRNLQLIEELKRQFKVMLIPGQIAGEKAAKEASKPKQTEKKVIR
jgi:hypothetical protein